MTISIRPARNADRAAILGAAARAWESVFAAVNAVLGPELAERLHGADWRAHQTAEVEAILDDDGMAAWVAELDGTVVGFAAAKVVDPDRRIGEIRIVGVEPAAQRRGVGGRLTEHAEGWLRDRDMAVVFVGTGGDPGHAPARRLYERLGYRAYPAVQFYKAINGESSTGRDSVA